MVHRPERLVDIFSLMRKYKIEPKKMRMVYSNKYKESKLVLIKGIKNAKPFLKLENNLYIYDENGEYTEEIKKIYNKKIYMVINHNIDDILLGKIIENSNLKYKDNQKIIKEKNLITI